MKFEGTTLSISKDAAITIIKFLLSCEEQMNGITAVELAGLMLNKLQEQDKAQD